MATRAVEPEDQEILDRAIKRIADWYTYWGWNNEQGKNEARFLYETQWNNMEIAELKRLRKPIIQINKIAPQIEKIIGQYRESTPTAEVYPDNSHVKQEELDLMANILRTLAYDSREDILVQEGFEQSLVRGYSALFCYNELEEGSAFRQTIKTRGMITPECSFFDPNAREPNKEDGDFCGYYDFMPRTAFKAAFPDVEIPTNNAIPMITGFRWMDKQGVAVCYYTEKEFYDTTSYIIEGEHGEEEIDKEELEARLASNQEVLDKAKEYETSGQEIPQDLMGKLIQLYPTTVINSAPITKHRIIMYKLIYGRILEIAELPSPYLNGVYVDGKSYFLDGKQKIKSFFSDAKDSQRIHNQAAVEQLSGLKNSRKEQFLMHKEHMPGDKSMQDAWRNPENQQGALIYSLPKDMRLPPTPTRLDPIPLNPIFTEVYQQTGMDIDQILGNPAAQTQNGGRTIGLESGQAVARKQANQDLLPHRAIDNMTRAYEQLNRIKLSLIPTIFDTDRTITLQSPSGGFTVERINQEMADGSVKNDIKSLHKKLNVRVTVGAPYQLRKEMAWNQLTSFVELFPQANNLIIDLAAKNIEIPESIELVKRTKTLLPPEFQQTEDGQPAPPKPPTPQEQMAQLQMQLAQQEIANKQQELQLKGEDHELEREKMQLTHEIELQKLREGASEMIVKSQMNTEKTNAEVTKAQTDASTHALTTLMKLASMQEKPREKK